MRSVGILPALALVAGATFGVQSGVSAHVPLLVACGALVLAVATWWRDVPRVAVPVIVAGVFLAEVAIAADAREHAIHTTLRAALDAQFGGFSIDGIGPEGAHAPQLLRAILSEDAAIGDQLVSLRATAIALAVRGRWVPVDGGVAVSVAGVDVRDRATTWRAGRTIVASVTFRRPPRYLDDGVPDAERDLALGGITLLGSVKSGLLVRVEAPGTRIDEAAASVRAFVRQAIARWVTPHDAVAGAIVDAVLIGDRTGLPDRVRDRLQAAGTYHVIAISGGNIAILAALVIGVLVVSGVHGRAGALLSIVVLVSYSIVVTAGPSVWRATLMATVYLLARLVDHRTPPWHAIALAAGVLVVWQPLDVRNAGFILTFGATAALLRGARIATAFGSAPRPIAWVAGSVAASLAAELALMPVAAHTFFRVTCAGLVLNLVAVPAMTVVQVGGMVVAATAGVPMIARVAGVVSWLGAVAIVDSARLVDVAPWLTTRTPSPASWMVVAYYVSLGAAVTVHRRRSAAVAGAVLTAAAIAAGVDPFRAAAAAQAPRIPLRLTVFDVGQGDAMLLQAGNDATLVDTGGAPFGGSFDIGHRVLAPALWARGVRSLQTLVVTHGDPDHIGGAAAVVDGFAPRDLWLGVPVPGHLPDEELVAAAARRHVRVDRVHAGDVTQRGVARLRVLNPPVTDWQRRRVRNDDSVVIEVTLGDVALLLTGDIGADVERAIVPQLTPARIRVLKVAHHGSRTSSRELLDGWRPQIAIVSAGRGNRFGHPAPEVVERLTAIGARIYRTDRDGEVTFETDGETVKVRTFVGGKR